MNHHALRVLEYFEVLDRVAARATSTLGREAVRGLRPHSDVGRLRRELSRVSDLMAFLEEDPGWTLPEIPDTRSALQSLAVEGSVLEPLELYRFGVLLASSGVLADALKGRGDQYPHLRSVMDRLHRDPRQVEAIRKAVDEEGAVLDSASKELRRIRSDLRQAHTSVVRKLEGYLRTLPDRIVVSDASVSIREGRYVIPVRREGRGEVGGIVHDESGTGQTLFVEPPVALELMNRIRELGREEAREVHRILQERTGALRPARDALAGTQDALVEMDSLYARARTALRWRAHTPELLETSGDGLELVEARHPLLLETDADSVVPFSVRLDPGERAVVISGPNTGGKTVLLKAIGLISALAQGGIHPPVGAGTRLPVFGSIFADIGDEQSIAQSLSTYSAHLQNLAEIVREAGAETLVLMDEMGTGTDPEEGAALARGVLEELVRRNALVFATSHLGALKRLDREESGIVNASLQFDSDRLEPTYLLVKGRPGRSFGLAIARRLGFPPEVLDRAVGYVSSEELRADALLERLEEKEKEATELARSLAVDQEAAAKVRAELEEREGELREEAKSAQTRARDDARRLLLEARQEVERAIREVREAATVEELEGAARHARQRVEEAARRQLDAKPGSTGPSRPIAAGEIRKGDRVRLPGSEAVGLVVEVRDERILVETGGIRISVSAWDVSSVAEQGGERSRAKAGGGWVGPSVDASSEIDLRGLRVEEVDHELNHALDQAVMGDLGELRIIHGKGTGALKERVGEILSADSRIRSFRLGRHGEGGAGITIGFLR